LNDGLEKKLKKILERRKKFVTKVQNAQYAPAIISAL